MLQYIRENEAKSNLLDFCEWMLAREQDSFQGPQQGTSIREMVRIWSIRQELIEKNGRSAAGLRELLARLRQRPDDERIWVVTYQSVDCFSLAVIATPSGDYLGFNRFVPATGIYPEEYIWLEKLATLVADNQ